ncbi:MAG TPA: gephyrin-like molybdotransferase Glp [Vicinamibacteria bacterium]|nr:gephyrin-like molybdotransferase Glp [Vicinamibacteria bacterium]
MIPVEQALRIVLDRAKPLSTEEIDFSGATGRLLREDVVSDVDMPPFPRSAVDGYAVRAQDVRQIPARLDVVGTIPAGTFPTFRVEAGQAASIMTGAPVPEGADAVQMVEHCRVDRDRVEVLTQVDEGQNVAPLGSEVRLGDVVLKEGTRLDPAAIAVAATVGKTTLVVGRKPRVAVAATGNELVHPSQKPAPGQIRNSNGFSLLAQCAATGIEATYLGVALDTESSLDEVITKGLDADVLMLSGGVSMGRFDLVEDVLARHRVRVHVDAVALKPGKPLVFGTTDKGKLVFGLPGNPVSTMVTFELFVRPALARLEGAENPVRPLYRAKLLTELLNRGNRRAYLPGWISVDDEGQSIARPIPTRGSGDIVAFSKSNALLIVPEDRERLEAGEPVRYYALDSSLLKEDRWRNGG